MSDKAREALERIGTAAVHLSGCDIDCQLCEIHELVTIALATLPGPSSDARMSDLKERLQDRASHTGDSFYVECLRDIERLEAEKAELQDHYDILAEDHKALTDPLREPTEQPGDVLGYVVAEWIAEKLMCFKAAPSHDYKPCSLENAQGECDRLNHSAPPNVRYTVGPVGATRHDD